jgi:DNA-binding transcriptional LysR family regulator
MRPSQIELEAVVAVARLGGFRAAARELGMSSSALSHAISALESRMGVRLFNRTTRSVALTAAGGQFVAEIAPALAAIRAAVERVDDHRGEPSGILRLNMAPGAARMILEPLILDYLRRFPTVGVEIAADNALIDVVGQGFDAGIRPTDLVPPDMIAVPVTRTLRFLVVGAPSYFADHGRPKTPADLAHHQCIRARMSSGAIYRWEFVRHGEPIRIDVPGALTLDDGQLMMQAALAGWGLTYLSEDSARGHIEAGRLEAVLQEWSLIENGVSLYYSSRRHVPAKLREFIALVREKSAPQA